jgi:hypothetical protein
MREFTKLRLTLDVLYDPQGVSSDWLKSQLHYIVDNALWEGLLTGASDATVEDWSADVVEVDHMDTADALITKVKETL